MLPNADGLHRQPDSGVRSHPDLPQGHFRSSTWPHRIEYLDNYQQAIVTVYRGDGNSYEGRQLTLTTNDGEQWVVIGETIGDSGQSE